MKIIFNFGDAVKFTANSFVGLLLVLLVYSIVKPPRSILSIGDILNNIASILVIYTIINLIYLIAKGTIKISFGKK